jgi:hypothetical protein
LSASGKTKTAWLVTAPFSLRLFLRTLENVLINKVRSRVVLGTGGAADEFPAVFAIAIEHGLALGIIRGSGAVFPSGGAGGATSQKCDQAANEKNLLGASFHKNNVLVAVEK